MCADNVVKLESIGFEWSLRTRVPHVDWDHRFNELKQYKVDHGDCNVPKGWKGNKQLAELGDSRQRDQYRLLKEGKPSPMTEERIGRRRVVVCVPRGTFQIRSFVSMRAVAADRT